MNGPGKVATASRPSARQATPETGDSEPLRRQSPFEILKLLAETTALSGALAYIAGWSSLFSYYNAFGIGLFGLEIPFTVGCVSAIRVVLHSVWPGLMLAVVAGGYVVFKPALRRPLQSALLVPAALFALAITVAFSGVRVGRAAAMADMLEPTSQLPLVAFVPTAKPSYPAPDCLAANTLDCRLLVHSGGAYYFFEPIKESGGGDDFSSLNVEVFSIRDGELALIRVQRGVK